MPWQLEVGTFSTATLLRLCFLRIISSFVLQIKFSFFNLNIKLCFYNCWQHTEFFLCIFILCGWLLYLSFVQEIRLAIEILANISWTCAYITLNSPNFMPYMSFTAKGHRWNWWLLQCSWNCCLQIDRL